MSLFRDIRPDYEITYNIKYLKIVVNTTTKDIFISHDLDFSGKMVLNNCDTMQIGSIVKQFRSDMVAYLTTDIAINTSFWLNFGGVVFKNLPGQHKKMEFSNTEKLQKNTPEKPFYMININFDGVDAYSRSKNLSFRDGFSKNNTLCIKTEKGMTWLDNFTLENVDFILDNNLVVLTPLYIHDRYDKQIPGMKTCRIGDRVFDESHLKDYLRFYGAQETES